MAYLKSSKFFTAIGDDGASDSISFDGFYFYDRAVAELVGNEGGVVSGVFNLESSDVRASDWRPRHDEHYHEV